MAVLRQQRKRGGGIAIDSIGNIYIAEFSYDKVRKIDTNGIITTIAGNGYSGFSGDWGDPLMAKLNFPEGVAVDDSGNIYIGDESNARVRMITNRDLAVNNLNNIEAGMTLYPNPCNGIFSVFVSAPMQEAVTITITDIVGNKLEEEHITTNQRAVLTIDVSPGIYFLSAATAQRSYYGSVN